jgi:hypothetical protein
MIEEYFGVLQSLYYTCRTDCFIADVSYRETGKESNRNANAARQMVAAA